MAPASNASRIGVAVCSSCYVAAATARWGKAIARFDRRCCRSSPRSSDYFTMPHTWSNAFDVRATPAGARGWGPGIWPARTWACGPSPDAASPPPKSVAAAETRRLVATRHGAVLVLLPEGADHDDILAALQDAHTRIQREIHADRQRRAA